MKSKFKKVLCMLLVICLMGSVPVEAYSSAYKADFEITGGVYVQKHWDLDKGGKLKIITNCSNPWGNESDNLVVIVQRKVGVVWKKSRYIIILLVVSLVVLLQHQRMEHTESILENVVMVFLLREDYV